MTFKHYLFCSLLLMCSKLCAQIKDTIALKEVVVADKSLYTHNKSQSLLVLNDSILFKNQPTLTNLLNYNSSLYFKEYGRGMLATVSFRGTTSSQTAVIWNGINVNSLLTGDADFNTFTTPIFSTITIKPGGGSVSYGSGAIGGTVHLNTNLIFKNKLENDLRFDYGSFNTQGINYKALISNKKWSTQIGFSRNSSTNDYDYLGLYTWSGIQRKNLNGQYAITNLSATIGYKINANSILTLYSQTSNTDRNTSLITESDAKTKYTNSSYRNLLEYAQNKKQWTSNYKLAYISEHFQYFEDIAFDDFSFGRTESLIAKAEYGFELMKSLKINGILDYNNTKGYGSSFSNKTRHIRAFSLKATENSNQKWINEFGFRKDVSADFESPYLFSTGSSYHFNSIYTLKINYSGNFRIPTFNDLYWQPGGNPNLKPERSRQAEIGNVFAIKNFTIKESIYFIKIKDMIRWVPGQGPNWSPENTHKVETYGSETISSWFGSYGKNNFSIDATYAYTISKNLETNKQLFFVPFHKATAALSYSRDRLSINYHYLYNGFVFTRSDNDPKKIINDYMVSNIGIDYDFRLINSFKFGIQVLNFLNEKYQSVADRPLPGRNFNMYINLKF